MHGNQVALIGSPVPIRASLEQRPKSVEESEPNWSDIWQSECIVAFKFPPLLVSLMECLSLFDPFPTGALFYSGVV